MGRFHPDLHVRQIARNPRTLARLHSLGAIAKVAGRFEIPGDGSGRILLNHIERQLILGPRDAASYARFRKARRALGAQDEPVSNAILQLLIDEFGSNVSQRTILSRLGGVQAAREHKERIMELAGSARCLGGKIRRGSVEELMECFPEELRGDIARALKEKKLPTIPQPDENHVGQIVALQNKQLRGLAALALVSSCIFRRSHAHRSRIVTTAKRLERILGTSGNQAERGARWKVYLSGNLLPGDGDDVRASMPERARWLRLRAVEGGNRVKRDFTSEFPALTPDLSPPRLRAAKLTAVVPKGELEEEIDLPDDSSPDGPVDTDKARRLRLLKLAPLVIDEVRIRIFELEEILKAFGSATKHMDEEGTFTVNLRLFGSDGRPAGHCTDHSFGFMDSQLFHSKITGAKLRVCRGYQPDPPDRKPYLFMSEQCGENSVWFAPLIRTRAIARSPLDIEPLDNLRLEQLAGTGLSEGINAPRGLLDFVGTDRYLACKAPHLGYTLVPIVEFYHAMLMAALVVINALRFGPRIGETMQIQLGRECMDVEKRGGRTVPILKLIPKGQHRPAIFDTDSEIRDLVRKIVRLTHSRWFPDCYQDGKIDLPLVRHGDPSRKNVAPGRFILRNATHALKSTDLGRFVKILLFGLIEMNSHDGRYVIATIMRVLGYDIDETGHVLHHAPGSKEARAYDLSGLLSDREIEELLIQLRAAGISGRAL